MNARYRIPVLVTLLASICLVLIRLEVFTMGHAALVTNIAACACIALFFAVSWRAQARTAPAGRLFVSIAALVVVAAYGAASAVDLASGSTLHHTATISAATGYKQFGPRVTVAGDTSPYNTLLGYSVSSAIKSEFARPHSGSIIISPLTGTVLSVTAAGS